MKKTLFYALFWAVALPVSAQSTAPDLAYPSATDNSATPPKPPAYYHPADAFRLQLAKRITYPDLARQTGAEGTVRVRIRVRPDGIGEQATIVKSAGLLLDRAALQAVYAILPWRFTANPGHRYSVDYPITFRFD